MAVYTLHLPAEARPGDPAALERAVLVKDGFAWGALIFSGLWFLWHRLWLGFLAVLAASIALALIAQGLGVPDWASTLAALLLGILFALEANAIRRWTLLRRGQPAVDAVFADDADTAEVRAFDRWMTRKAAAAATTPDSRQAPSRPLAPAPVIGLFPEAEGGR